MTFSEKNCNTCGQKCAIKYHGCRNWIPMQSEWIPVSERLPKEDGQYLITVKYKHVNDSYEDVYAEHGEWYDGRWDMFCFGHCGEVEEIIAWMPLPKPYKAESEDRNEMSVSDKSNS